jgi:hypothetical protein
MFLDDDQRIPRRDVLKAGGLLAGAGLCGANLRALAAAVGSPRPRPGGFGDAELVRGLDGMSRVADAGRDVFVDGHVAAAVLCSVFFGREQEFDADTWRALQALVEARLLAVPIFAPCREEPADEKLVDGLVEELDVGIGSLRRSGHDIIFAALSLKALREVPAAATPARIRGLRAMVRSFGTEKVAGARLRGADPFVGLDDEPRFVRFALAEYLRALDLYRTGRGHHGFAGHALTVAHALLQLARLGHRETAHKGVPAYHQLVQRARDGADLGGQRIAAAPPRFATPLQKDYWIERSRKPAGILVSSHLVKYPYSFYALAKELPDDDELKQRALQSIYHLTAVS